MEKLIIIKERTLVDYIESLNYEIMARKDIIVFMLNNNMNTNSDSFEKYHKEYEEFLVQFETAKKQLEAMYITDDIKKEMNCENIHWNLDYNTATLSLRS